MKKAYILLLAAVTLVSSCKGGYKPFDSDAQQLYLGDDVAVATTKYGKVRGYIIRDTYTFLGIPYGASTEGDNRFMPPQEPKPWDGVRLALFYGACAPQEVMKYPGDQDLTFLDRWNYYDMSEDCLNLNVWTPGLDGKKRPVLVWFHGGGFTSGNSYEHDEYLGENFSRYGDVVFVSPNHRLGPFGFSDFSGVDDKYKDSGNVGLLDLVASLRWVKENIAQFGGDPDNITIMGQSGGGAKVCDVIAMPDAKGLVQKAVALSGNTTSAMDSSLSRAIGKAIYEKAGSDMSKLAAMSYEEYLHFAKETAAEYCKSVGKESRSYFAPVADGVHLPTGDYYPEGGQTDNIPLLICSTTDEWSYGRTDKSLYDSSKETIIALMKGTYGENAEAVYDAYDSIFPGRKPSEVYGLSTSGRERLLSTAEDKAKQSAPVWTAWFDWQPPHFDGRLHAFHTMDIAFWFMNTDLMLSHTTGGIRPRRLSMKMASALVNFMKTGNPNGKTGLPDWPAYTQDDKRSIVLTDKSYVIDDSEAMSRIQELESSTQTR